MVKIIIIFVREDVKKTIFNGHAPPPLRFCGHIGKVGFLYSFSTCVQVNSIQSETNEII